MPIRGSGRLGAFELAVVLPEVPFSFRNRPWSAGFGKSARIWQAAVRLLVTDTGSGIPPEVLERMFDPFCTTKRAGEGTGLGLSLVHGIVADFGGAIDVVTQVGAGTTVTIWLPATLHMK